MGPSLLQVQILDAVVIPLTNFCFCSQDNNLILLRIRVKLCIPFKNQAKLQDIDVVHLFNLDNVNDRHGDVDVDRDVDTVHFVKAEWCNFLVVIVLLGKM